MPVPADTHSIDIALFQPDIPGNAGTLLRLGACLGITIHIIEPAGFRLDDKALRRAGMDYIETATLQRHASWPDFSRWRTENRRRLLLLTVSGSANYLDQEYRAGDILLVGRESAGVPDEVHTACDARLRIQMRAEIRSLNVAVSAAMVAGEALRQLR